MQSTAANPHQHGWKVKESKFKNGLVKVNFILLWSFCPQEAKASPSCIFKSDSPSVSIARIKKSGVCLCSRCAPQANRSANEELGSLTSPTIESPCGSALIQTAAGFQYSHDELLWLCCRNWEHSQSLLKFSTTLGEQLYPRRYTGGCTGGIVPQWLSRGSLTSFQLRSQYTDASRCSLRMWGKFMTFTWMPWWEQISLTILYKEEKKIAAADKINEEWMLDLVKGSWLYSEQRHYWCCEKHMCFFTLRSQNVCPVHACFLPAAETHSREEEELKIQTEVDVKDQLELVDNFTFLPFFF